MRRESHGPRARAGAGVKHAIGSVLFAAWVALAGSGCATDVQVDFDPHEDFSRYHTWDWLPAGWKVAAPGGRVDRGLDALVRGAIERELSERGYQRVPSRDADFLVTYHVSLELQLVRVMETPAVQTLHNPHREGGFEVTASRPSLQAYEKGTLVLDVADGRDRQLVWRGIGTRRVRESFKNRVDEVVSKVFESFPPGGGSWF